MRRNPSMRVSVMPFPVKPVAASKRSLGTLTETLLIDPISLSWRLPWPTSNWEQMDRIPYNLPPMWKPRDRVTHRFHSELGTGRILAVQGRSLKVEFPEVGQTLSFAAGTDALVPLAIAPGGRARLGASGELVV